MVARGMRFSNGFAATPVCGPVWGSGLTGKEFHDTRVGSNKGARYDLVDFGRSRTYASSTWQRYIGRPIRPAVLTIESRSTAPSNQQRERRGWKVPRTADR